ncbi:methylamine utilization protein MauE [Opitutia bacterium ISCC 51]|nr:methylamine utilization protein MauE [Opitutae bacterium ISCC 51]QXD29026.1 methylamine utilization protein MauE [Opitutae bacterium ISCC 52]
MAGSSQISLWIYRVIRLVLAGFFIVAGGLKIWDPQSLTAAIETYQVLPYSLAVLLSLYMPWLEVLAGIGVLFKKLYGGSLLIIGGLLLLFIIALVQGWIRGLDVTCGCFGNADQMNKTNYPLLVGRDILLLVATGLLWIRHSLNDRH